MVSQEHKTAQVLYPGIDLREFTIYVANMTRWMRNELIIDSHGKLTLTLALTLTLTLILSLTTSRCT